MSTTIENIKARIDTLKNDKAQAEGQKKAIEDTWKRDFNVSSLEEAEALCASIAEELETAKAAQEKYLKDADELLTAAGV